MIKIQALLVIALLSVIFISGCAEVPFLSGLLGGTSVKQYEHDIIVIRDMQVTPAPSVKPFQSINLHVYIKDVEAVGKKQKAATVTLYDTCGIFDVTNLQGCTGDGYTRTGKIKCEMEMYPQSENELIWTLMGKDIKVEQTCNVGVQVEYKHKTSTISSVEFASKAEVENMIQQGKGKVTTGKMTVGDGPVKLYIQVAGQPILLSNDKKGDLGSGIIEFWVENKGSGIVPNNKVDKYSIKSMESTIAKIKFKKSDGKDIVDEISTEKNGGDAPKNLIRGKTPTMSWILVPVSKSNELDKKISFTLQLEGVVEYSYKFTKTIPITVQPLL